MPQMRRGYIGGQIKIDTLLAFIFGLIFVSAILYFAVTVVNPNPLQIWTFKTVLALAAGGIAAVLPGQFEIKHLGFVRAGGALAVFAAVFFAPISVVSPVTQLKAPTEDPAPVVRTWFELIDTRNYQAAWEQADPATSQWYNINYQNFVEVFRNTRQPLGKVVFRRLMSRGDFTNPPGYPPGLYRNLLFLSKYENSPQCIQEAIALRATEALHWRVFSYQISYAQMPCMQESTEVPAAEESAGNSASPATP